MSIASQLETVKSSLPEGICLVAVSKMHPAEAVREAYDAGQRIFGESRPQELRSKYEELPKDIEWHMIGHLQTNKVKYIIPFVSLIHSLDSVRLAETIQTEAAKCGRVVDVLLEIHVAEEDTKSGWDFAELDEFISGGALSMMPNIRVRGVMGIATNSDDEAVIRRDFAMLHDYKERIASSFDEHFDTLSIGMSGDYPIALDYGATMVRVGSLIFGQRDYSK